MAVVSMCSVFSSKKHAHPTINGFTQIERGIIDCHLPGQKFKRWCVSTSLLDECSMRWNTLQHGSELFLKSIRMQRAAGFCVVDGRSMLFQNSVVMPVLKVYNKGSSKMSESSSMEKDSSQRQLKALDCYFGKLHDDMNEQRSSCVPVTSNFENSSDKEAYQTESSLPLEGKVTESSLNQYETKTGLDSLENYFEKLNPAIHTEKGDITKLDGEVSERDPVRTPTSAVSEHYRKESVIAEKNDYTYLQSTNDEIGQGLQDLQAYSEASDLYPVNLLVAINIAVFLFEIASPIRNSELEQMSLPLIYGGKINKLILDGEWWRLLTPMFLHSGLLHVTLSCWVLLIFGPQVCRRYGPFTFFLIFVLGGLCGNLTSFLHTTELTVCGTGPAFAIIGAWLVFQIQNKQIVAKEVSESMFWKAVIATALSFILSNFGRIDDWMHLGATFSGIIYGYLTCPTLHVLDNAASPSKNEIRKQGVALVQQQADPCKSLGIFIISIFVIFACFTFFLVPQVEILELDGYI